MQNMSVHLPSLKPRRALSTDDLVQAQSSMRTLRCNLASAHVETLHTARLRSFRQTEHQFQQPSSRVCIPWRL